MRQEVVDERFPVQGSPSHEAQQCPQAIEFHSEFADLDDQVLAGLTAVTRHGHHALIPPVATGHTIGSGQPLPALSTWSMMVRMAAAERSTGCVAPLGQLHEEPGTPTRL